MTTKEIMANVNKAKAQEFMAVFKPRYNAANFPMGPQFTAVVRSSLSSIGFVDIEITNGTANAIVERMEKKSGIKF